MGSICCHEDFLFIKWNASQKSKTVGEELGYIHTKYEVQFCIDSWYVDGRHAKPIEYFGPKTFGPKAVAMKVSYKICNVRPIRRDLPIF